MDRFRAIEVFCRIVEAGSFARAAADLNVPPATASTLIKGLEARLSVRLLERTTRRVSVTDEGRVYYARASAILDDLTEADEEVRSEASDLAGQVRIAAPRHLVRAVLIPALPAFTEAHPALDLDFVLGDQPVDLVAGSVDIALRIGPLVDSGLTVRTLGAFPRVTCAAPSYLERTVMPTTPDHLPPQRLAYRFPGQAVGYPWSFERDERRIEIRPVGGVSFDDLDAYIDAACAGLGVIQVLWFQAKAAIERGALRTILPEWTGELVSVSAVTTERRHRARRVRRVLDWLDTTVTHSAAYAKDEASNFQRTMRLS